MITLNKLARKRRAEMTRLREVKPEIAALDTGFVDDEELLPELLVEMGTKFDVVKLGADGDCFGSLPGQPKPPREEGGAMPGFSLVDQGEKGFWYVQVSKAWMRANCAVNPLERLAWLNIMDLYRNKREPKWLPADNWPSQYPKPEKDERMPWERLEEEQAGMQLPWSNFPFK